LGGSGVDFQAGELLLLRKMAGQARANTQIFEPKAQVFSQMR
jgi:hypothetical protein